MLRMLIGWRQGATDREIVFSGRGSIDELIFIDQQADMTYSDYSSVLNEVPQECCIN